MSEIQACRRAFQLAIFDLDGTLLDTLSDLAYAMNAALESHGLRPIERDEYRFLVGFGIRNLSEQAVERQGVAAAQKEALIGRVMKSFREIYDRRWSAETDYYPGIQDLLHNISAAGTEIAVLSNKADDLVRAICAHYFPAQRFAFVSGLRQDWPKKPDPALLLHLVEHHAAMRSDSQGVQDALARECICLIGDSASDMEIARRAAYVAVGVTWGFRSEAELRSSGADFICHNTKELEALILRPAFAL